MRLFAALFALVACLQTFAQPSRADTRVALVIGNGAYQNAPRLPNPLNDAEDVAAALKRSGFETISGSDMDKAAMEDAAVRFARAARNADVALFYYSGHAIQFAGINYLAPVDIKLTDEADLRRMVRLDDIVADIEQAKNLRILVLDACRDNPLADQLKRSIGTTRALPLQRGLAKLDTPQGMIVAYATQADRTAEDGIGRNSPYTSSFLKHIEEQEEIGTIFRRVSSDVYEATNHAQLPELSLSLIGEFYLRGRVELKVPLSAVPNIDACGAAEAHWKSTEAIGTVAAFEDHLARFPNCAFAGLALVRIDNLKVAAAALPVKPPMPPAASDPCGGKTAVSYTPTTSPHPLSTAEECALRPKDEFRECVTCPAMVVVPAGSFIMGSSQSEAGHSNQESPQHAVTIGKAFAVGKFTVTFDEWDACVAAGGCNGAKTEDRGWGRGKQPVFNISWNDGQAYAAWISKTTGKSYRLLTEAEWEYAARAGKPTPFWWGSMISTDQANFDGREGYADGRKEAYRGRPIPVDSFAPNGFGIYNMQGNIWQWVEDCARKNYSAAPIDGGAVTGGSCDQRVLRGGAWNSAPSALRAANRLFYWPDYQQYYSGIRLARSLNP